jgi:hypothetical protein
VRVAVRGSRIPTESQNCILPKFHWRQGHGGYCCHCCSRSLRRRVAQHCEQEIGFFNSNNFEARSPRVEKELKSFDWATINIKTAGSDHHQIWGLNTQEAGTRLGWGRTWDQTTRYLRGFRKRSFLGLPSETQKRTVPCVAYRETCFETALSNLLSKVREVVAAKPRRPSEPAGLDLPKQSCMLGECCHYLYRHDLKEATE